LYIVALVIGVMLQSRELFGTTAFVPIIPIASGFVGVLISPQSAGVYSVVGGFTVGSALALIVQVIAWRRVSSGQPRVLISLPALRHLRSNIAAVSVASACSFLLPVLLRLYASDLGQGTVAAFGFATQILALPIALLVTPVGTVFLPRLSATIQHEKAAAGLPVLRVALTITILTSAIATAIAVALAEPIVALLFERGSFTARDTNTTAEAVRFLGLGLVALTTSSIFGRVLCAGGMATSFALVWVVTVVAFAASAMALLPEGGVVTLAGLHSAAYVVVAGLLLHIVDVRIVVGGPAHALVSWVSTVALRVGISAVAGGLASWSAYNVLSGWLESGSQPGLPDLLVVTMSAGAGFAVFAAGVLLLRGKEAQELRGLTRSHAGADLIAHRPRRWPG
jgi:putative peptidoglycan lipid II flippase